MFFLAHGTPGQPKDFYFGSASVLAHANTLAVIVKGSSEHFFRRLVGGVVTRVGGDSGVEHGTLTLVTMAVLPTTSESDLLSVVLVSPRNPLNIGAAARAMSNLGFTSLRVVNPYEASFREARSAVGAASLLKNAEEYKAVADAVADCSLVVGTTAAHNRELH